RGARLAGPADNEYLATSTDDALPSTIEETLRPAAPLREATIAPVAVATTEVEPPIAAPAIPAVERSLPRITEPKPSPEPQPRTDLRPTPSAPRPAPMAPPPAPPVRHAPEAPAERFPERRATKTTPGQAQEGHVAPPSERAAAAAPPAPSPTA